MDVYIEIAEDIKKEVSKIFRNATRGRDKRYRTVLHGLTKWGLVESDIHAAIDYYLTSDKQTEPDIQEESALQYPGMSMLGLR